MKIEDQGIILSQKHIQENMLLLKILSKNNGICTGMARKVRGKKAYDYQVGNLVKFERFARLDNQLGVINCERIESFCGKIIESKINLYSFKNLANIITSSFKEFDTHINIYYFLAEFLELIDKISWLKYINFELEILKNAGYSLQISKCAVHGAETEVLSYVSPKSGRAVCLNAAIGLESQLLALPHFVFAQTEPESAAEVNKALDLTEYFLKRYIWSKNFSNSILEDRLILRNLIPNP
ncbi:MAG: DNA repair protein RecO [Rickettsiaceae bacterium]|nr:DNA repair protein RecO [Rickettsiaceae bacterium]